MRRRIIKDIYHVKKPTYKEVKEQANSAYRFLNECYFNGELPQTDIHLSNDKIIREGNAAAFYDVDAREIYISIAVWKDWDTTAMIQNLFHEMIHMYNHIIKQVSDIEYKGTQYHTKQFLTTALEHGGAFPYTDADPENGFSDIELPAAAVMDAIGAI